MACVGGEPRMRPRHVVVLCTVAWLVFLIAPSFVMPLGYAAYICLPLFIGWSAIYHRSAGWFCGFVLAFALIFLPAWVLGFYWLYEWSMLTGPE